MNKVNQLQFNQIYQEHYSSHVLEQLSQKKIEELKKQRENLRRQIFFTPIQFTANNIHDNSNLNNQCSEYSFFETLGTTNFFNVKNIFINEVNEFIEVTNYFAENKYNSTLKKLIRRIHDEQKPESKSKLIDHFRCCVLSLHNLTLVLNILKYQLEQNNTSTKNIFSKDSITFYLDDCIVDLDKCWAGISSRFTHKYNCLSSLNGGIIGRINIIKQELLDALLTEYLNAKKQEDIDLFLEDNEIHIRNSLNNAIHEILGIHKIEDPLEDKSLKASVRQEFIELATIEISPARITSMLADDFYQDLTMILDKTSMSSWITEYKSDEQIFPDLLSELHAKFFDKINILFEASEENKLTLNYLLYFLEKEEEPIKHCLYQSKEKIQKWIAKRLIPNTEKVFVKDIANGLTIWSIDYIFFGVSKTADNNNQSNSENYIRLQLSHIQNIDFINFTNIEPSNNCYLSDYKEKTTTSITLITQAAQQTDALGTVEFILNPDNITKLNELPLLKTKLKNILNSKLTNASFKNEFSDIIIKLIKNNYEFNLNEIYYLFNNSTCNHFLIAMRKQNICIDNLLEKINIKYLDNIAIEILKEISAETKKLLFKKAVNANNCEFIYQLLCASDFNKYTVYNDITNNENLFDLAIEYKHIKLVELLLQDKTLNIKDYNLFSSYYNGHCKIISLCITHIFANKARFTNDTFIKHLQTKSKNGYPGLYIALQNGHKKIAVEYINAILNIDGITIEQKLDLIQAKSDDGHPGLYIALQNNHEKTVTAYINTILNINIDEVTAEQKLKLIAAESGNGFPGLFAAIKNGHEKTVTAYINTILNSNYITEKQKLKLIQAKSEYGYSGLYVALHRGYEKTVAEYFKVIVVSKKFTLEQKAMIFTDISETNLVFYNELVNNSHLTVEEKNYLLEANSGTCIIL